MTRRQSLDRQLVFASVRLNTIAPDEDLINVALGIVEKISEPVEYINSLMAIYSMVRHDRAGAMNYFVTCQMQSKKFHRRMKRLRHFLILSPSLFKIAMMIPH